MTKADVNFTSPEELAALLEQVGLKLHAKNRIAGGESGIVWHLAETIRALGDIAARIATDEELHCQYGDGDQPGLVAGEAQRAHFLNLLAEALSVRR